MRTIKDFSSAFFLFFESFTFIRQHSLWFCLFWPLTISLLYLLLLVWLSYIGLFQFIYGLAVGIFGGAGQELGSWLSFFVSSLALSSALIFALLTYRFLLSIVILPFLGPLLHKIEKIIVGKSIEISLKEDLRNAVYGIRSSLRISLYSLFILALSFFTGPLQIPINFIAQAYFMGRANFDYIFEKAIPEYPNRKDLIRKKRCAILGNGCACLLFLYVPVLGLLLGPILGLGGAALWYYRKP